MKIKGDSYVKADNNYYAFLDKLEELIEELKELTEEIEKLNDSLSGIKPVKDNFKERVLIKLKLFKLKEKAYYNIMFIQKILQRINIRELDDDEKEEIKQTALFAKNTLITLNNIYNRLATK
ncbi:hypothetical protein NAMH_1497 [Nautilia profundicola AmH]|uniref:Uncharacterized protein n=1 Tax=Nautilia profundicola (strain ATCC BAA-1463 / DSM 18972 / AmH) TaxID=598659 RepID=B9L699_NAUPA|nr:hypothetical protein [Nautilia profundicola]ACM92913.1 hypothetical protein NAMH_1497 [Nautilia profundicola AmH]